MKEFKKSYRAEFMASRQDEEPRLGEILSDLYQSNTGEIGDFLNEVAGRHGLELVTVQEELDVEEFRTWLDEHEDVIRLRNEMDDAFSIGSGNVSGQVKANCRLVWSKARRALRTIFQELEEWEREIDSAVALRRDREDEIGEVFETWTADDDVSAWLRTEIDNLSTERLNSVFDGLQICFDTKHINYVTWVECSFATCARLLRNCGEFYYTRHTFNQWKIETGWLAEYNHFKTLYETLQAQRLLECATPIDEDRIGAIHMGMEEFIDFKRRVDHLLARQPQLRADEAAMMLLDPDQF